MVLAGVVPAASASAPPPQTPFERSGGSEWTTLDQERRFLADVDRGSSQAVVSIIGRTVQGRPLHLVRIGSMKVAQARNKPVALVTCTQHGNEPAPREGCLKALRDLAFASDRKTVALLSSWTVLFVPLVNPDGYAANTRENSRGTDINRDHLNLVSREAQVLGRVIRDWRPDILLDLHEYGPGVPVLYDDDVLYLWPRNLNVDPQVYALSRSLAIDYIGKGAERAGFTSDEYGLYAVGDQDLTQTAGDGDEGILRNAAGLRHTIGILVESRVDMGLSPGEIAGGPAAVNLRRVASQRQAVGDTLRFMREQVEIVELATEGAPTRKAKEGKERSAPVYFGGADNDPPEPSQIQDPPPCGYRLTGAQAKKLKSVFGIHGITTKRSGNGVIARMSQGAEPVIPLLLDRRGARKAVQAEALARC